VWRVEGLVQRVQTVVQVVVVVVDGVVVPVAVRMWRRSRPDLVLFVVEVEVRGCEIETLRSRIEPSSFYSPPWSWSSS
jgi:hypothetical protein